MNEELHLDHKDASPPATEDHLLYQSGLLRITARQLPDGSRIILKELHGPEAMDRVRHERRILERLRGVPGVPRLTGGLFPATVIAMEHPGAAPLPLGQPLEPSQLVSLAERMARVLGSVHRLGVIHRNINPESLLVSGDLTPTLIDFGLATTFAEERPPFLHHREIAGNLGYLAPEQTGRTGRSVDERADLYSLGATLYRFASGIPPFTEKDKLQLLHDILAKKPQPLSELAPGVPRPLSDLVMRLLEKEPDRRYQSAEGVAHDLARLAKRLSRGETGIFPLGEHDLALRLSPPSQLVGRQREIEALASALQNCVRGAGSLLLVCGGAGVGKSALINELRPMVAARGGFFAAGKFDQYRRDLSTDAIYQAVRALGRLLLAEPEAELELFRRRIRQGLGANVPLVASVLPEYALLLRVAAEPVNVDPVKSQQRLVQATVDNLRSVASAERPVVLVLEDLQWADVTPLAFVEAIMTGQPLPGLLVVASFRDRELEEGHPLSGLLARRNTLSFPPPLLRLANLPAGELARFLEEMLRLPFLEEMLRLPRGEGARLAEAVGLRTGGNPYHTLELINVLRSEGTLTWHDRGWSWQEEAIGRHAPECDLVELLEGRLEALPAGAQALIEVMACLGGELDSEVLAATAELTPPEYEQAIATCIGEGVVVAGDGARQLRFRHDRVQQAASRRLRPEQRRQTHLRLARTLVERPGQESLAAEQYLPVLHCLKDPVEIRRTVEVLRIAASGMGAVNYREAERFLTAALTLTGQPGLAERKLLLDLHIERHAALYGLGRLDEGDLAYRQVESLSGDPLERVEAACLQVCSLTNRARPAEALALGLCLLKELGVAVPPPERLHEETARGLREFREWLAGDAPAGDRRRGELAEPLARAAANLMNRIIPPAFFADQALMSWWLVLESRRLWAEQGPCAALVGPLSHLSFVSIWLEDDYRSGQRAVSHVLSVSEERGWEPESSQCRFLYAMTVGPWFEPLRLNVALSLRAEEGLIKGGDLQNACFTYYATVSQLLDCAPTLEGYQAEVERALMVAAATGNRHVEASLLPYRELVKELRGEDGVEPNWGTLANDNPTPAGIYHTMQALAAALRDDQHELASHVEQTGRFIHYLQGTYLKARAALLSALSLARQAQQASPDRRTPILARLDQELAFLAGRAADAPGTFRHQLLWVQAERAWGAGEPEAALACFDAALKAAGTAELPWQRAFLTERAALFMRQRGLQRLAAGLLAEAVELYREWGALGKVRRMEADRSLLLPGRLPHHGGGRTTGNTIDMLAVLRASQALSSETSLQRLTALVAELLKTLTGASNVSLLVREEQSGQWQLVTGGDQEAGSRLPMEETSALGLLPLSVVRYALRTGEPLLLGDAGADDRFSQDPHLSGGHCRSVLAVPIVNHGTTAALLLLEDRLHRDAFTPDLLDAVTLIGGQLAVSLENALLYQSLEEAVRRRTTELARANEALQADIVERKRAEQQTSDAYRRLSDILEFLPDATLVIDAEGRVIAWNRAMEEISGVKKKDILGQGEQAYAIPFYGKRKKVLIDMLDEDPADRERHYPGVRAEGKTLIAEARVMLGDGVHWLWSAATPLYDMQGLKVGGIQSLRDVTELRQSEQERSRLEAQLHHASMMESLMGQLGHDLKTPLTPLCALLPMIGRKSEDPAITRMVDICRQSVDQIHALSSKALELVRLSCQQAPPHQTPVQLRNAVDCCLAGCDSLFLRRGINCLNTVDAGIAVQAAADQLNLLLDNLLSNAARFAREGGCIEISAALEGDTAIVSVTDDGLGLKPGETDRIFEEFFKVDPARHDPNTQGLGLAICKRIVLNHKGRIWAESPGIGKGTTVSFTLKLAAATA